MQFSRRLIAATIALLLSTPTLATESEHLYLEGAQITKKETLSAESLRDYLPDFPAVSRSIIGRADGSKNVILQNNIPAPSATINPGDTFYYTFPSSILQGPRSTATPIIPLNLRKNKSPDEESHSELRKRDGDVHFWLTLSVCSQPTGGSSISPPGQLSLLVSQTNPTPGTGDGPQPPSSIPVEEGFGEYDRTTSDNLYIAVVAPQGTGLTGAYIFELVVSIDAPYTSYQNMSNLTWVDSDSGAAIFVSSNLITDDAQKQTWDDLGPKFTMFVANQNDTQYNGLTRSYCAFRNTTETGGSIPNQKNTRVEVGLTTYNASLQQQFYVSGLNKSTNYNAYMGLPTEFNIAGSGQPGGGGVLYRAINFTTKTGNYPLLEILRNLLTGI
jgi:calcium channel MID1